MKKTLQFIDNLIMDKTTFLLFVVFTISVLLRLPFCLPFNGPILFFDEYFYKENALYLLDFKYFTNHYPPFYSMLLMFGFAFEDYYSAFKIINIILSSLIILPTWHLSREFLSKKTSFIIVIISLLLPYHIVYNKMVMSENIFYTLFMAFIYFLYKQIAEKDIKWAILTGISIGFCILTRYFAIVLIPVYILTVALDLYLRKDIIQKDEIRKIGQIILIGLGVISIVFGGFLIYNYNDFFKTSSEYLAKGSAEASEYRLFSWIIMYFSYSILITGPFIFSILTRFKSYFFNKDSYKESIFLSICIFTSIAFILLAAQHSAGGTFAKKYMNGRYIMYISLPWIIFSFFKIKNEIQTTLKFVLGLISMFIIFISYLFLSGKIYTTADWLLIPHMSPNGFIFVNYFIPIYLFIGLLIVSNSVNKYKSAFYPLVVFLFFVISLIGNKILKEPIMEHGNALLKCINEPYRKVIYHNTACYDYQFTYFMDFWGKYGFKVKPIPVSSQEYVNGYLIVPYKIKRNIPLETYHESGKTFYIYKTPLNISNSFSSLLKDSSSVVTFVDQKNRKDNPFKYNISYVANVEQVFCIDNCQFYIDVVKNNKLSYSFYSDFGFYPSAKNWGISDGMNFKITYVDSLNNIILIDKYILPSDDDYEFAVDLPSIRSEKFRLIFSTEDPSFDDRGDWGCWKNIELESKK